MYTEIFPVFFESSFEIPVGSFYVEFLQFTLVSLFTVSFFALYVGFLDFIVC